MLMKIYMHISFKNYLINSNYIRRKINKSTGSIQNTSAVLYHVSIPRETPSTSEDL